MIEEGGGLGGHSPDTVACPRHHLLDFVRQCVTAGASVAELETALCSHYKVKDVRSLGQGSAERLLKLAETPRETIVSYEAAVCLKDRSGSGQTKLSKSDQIKFNKRGGLEADQVLAEKKSKSLIKERMGECLKMNTGDKYDKDNKGKEL